MTPDPESRGAVADADVEQEVDLGRYWRAVVARWWLPVAGLVAGAIIGFVATLGGSAEYRATAQVYLGQPLAPGGAADVTTAQTTLGLVSNLVKGDGTLRDVAEKVGLKPSRLRGRVSAKPILGVTGGRLGTPAPILAITVTGSPPAKVAAAANELAAVAVRETSGYTDTKIQALKDQLAFDEREIASANRRLEAARAQQQEILADKSLAATERLLLLANVNTTLITLEQRLGQLEQDRLETRQQLSLAEEIEKARVVDAAVAVKTAGPSRRTGVIVGALIGLLVGALAAVLWDPVARRMRPGT